MVGAVDVFAGRARESGLLSFRSEGPSGRGRTVRDANAKTNISGMPRELATAAPAVWGDDELDPGTFEPVNIRPYFVNRASYRTRGGRRGLRQSRLALRIVCRPLRRARGTSRMHRARRVARTCGSRGDPHPPGDDDDDDHLVLRRRLREGVAA